MYTVSSDAHIQSSSNCQYDHLDFDGDLFENVVKCNSQFGGYTTHMMNDNDIDMSSTISFHSSIEDGDKQEKGFSIAIMVMVRP